MILSRWRLLLVALLAAALLAAAPLAARLATQAAPTPPIVPHRRPLSANLLHNSAFATGRRLWHAFRASRAKIERGALLLAFDDAPPDDVHGVFQVCVEPNTFGHCWFLCLTSLLLLRTASLVSAHAWRSHADTGCARGARSPPRRPDHVCSDW